MRSAPSEPTNAHSMRAAILTGYGGADKLQVRTVPRPKPGAGQVLVRVRAAGINDWDWGLVTGMPRISRLFQGLFRPRRTILGLDVAGEVTDVGPGVTRFRRGDRVLGDLSSHGFGGFAEFVATDDRAFTRMPDTMSFTDAAALPHAANLALQALTLADASMETARLNVERQRILETKGLASKRQVELAELEETRARTEVERARVALASAKNEERAIEADRSKVSNDANAGINDARATRASAESEIANANAEIARLDVRLARQSTLSITAPRDGVIFRIVANGHSGNFVKSGDVLAVLVPDTADRAVEVSIDGNDMPLVQEGSVVRVAFEGWPAVQFSGWPSVALGTFEGRVAIVDASDAGDGKFRILVTPAPGTTWPEGKYLRQGVRAHAWVQLGRVRLGYELWRQFNGFAPSLPKPPEKGAAK